MRQFKIRYQYLAVAVVLLIVAIIWIQQQEMKGETEGISVAVAARELSLVISDRETILDVDGTKFAVADRDNWYVTYMDYLYASGLLWEESTAATRKGAAKALTVGELRTMADGLGIWQSSEIWEENGLEPGRGERDSEVLPEAIWLQFLTEARKRFDPERGVETKELSIYATAANIHEIPAWNVLTTEGMYTFQGISMDAYLDSRVEVWARGAEIIRVMRVAAPTVTYENMLVGEVNGKKLTVYFHGYTRLFALPERVELTENQVIDLEISRGQVKGIRRKKETVGGRIVAVENSGAEIEGYGVLPFSDSLRIYQIYGKKAEKTISDLMIGYDIYDVIVAEGEIAAIRIRQSPDVRTIRVLLTDKGGSEKLHASVSLSSNQSFSAQVGQNSLSFLPGEQVMLRADGIYRWDEVSADWVPVWTEVDAGQRIMLKTTGQWSVSSFTRSFGIPTYFGEMEVLPAADGVYLINEVQIEDYLCGVVPAEMPHTYHMEALKAQAISARGFAVKHLTGSTYRELGAHVDDTENFQVYNYSAREERTDQAVRETYGQVLTLNDEIVTTYYFSTSCGYTSDISLWGQDPKTAPYLISRRLSGLELVENVQDEEVFRAFIRNTELNDYECNYGWYRWKVEVSLDELTVIVNTNLAKLNPALNSRVLTKQADGSWAEGPGMVGRIEKIEVLERGVGGIASLVEIAGKEGTVRLALQSTIREVLGSTSYVYDRMDGSQVWGRANLASAYMYPEPILEEGILIGYRFFGGGSGHGVGMAQNCANVLGQSGIGAGEILKFFYVGTEVATLYR